jgi:hypothetical protein
MTIAYLDPDDEITNAVARLRASKDVRVALVLPTGSRIATSRINFRLLAHEALAHTRRLAIVAAEPGVRAVAISAGLPAYATVVEYEAALQEASAGRAAGMDEAVTAIEPKGTGSAPKAARSRARAGKAAAAGDLAVGATAAGVAAGAAAPPVSTGYLPPVGAPPGAPASSGAVHRGGGPDLPVVTARDRSDGGGRRWLWVGISGLLVVALVVAAGWIAFNVLPTATITVVPHTQAAQPVDLTVIADPTATAVDTTRGVVPAQVVTIPLTATDTFNATGTKPVDSAATGTVTFVSNDTGRSHTIPQGTEVSTQGGIAFHTTQAVTVPRARVIPPTGLSPGRASVGVSAASTGPSGNVAAGAIDRVSSTIEAALVNFNNPVTNAAPTTGGAHTVIQVIQQSDYDAAVASLRATLKTQLDAAALDPTNVPAGVTLIAASATVGTTTADQAASALVNKQKDNFTLTVSGNGTIDGVDQTQVQQVAAARLTASVPSGYQLFPSTVQTQVGPAVVNGGQISFSASATGQIAATLDPAVLLSQVRGKTVGQARTILEALGTVTIETSPFYVSSIPDDPSRVTITVQPPQPGASGAPATGVPTSPPAGTIAPATTAPVPTASPSGS